MEIDRYVDQHDTAEERVRFCLDMIEKNGCKMSAPINKSLSVEEVIGALVAAEQHIRSKGVIWNGLSG